MGPNTTNTGAGTDPENTGPAGINLAGKIVANMVVSCRTEGEDGAILFNPDTDTTLLINPVGIVTWNYLSEPRTVEEIVDYISRSYSNSPDHDSVRKDIETFLADLAPDFVSEVEDNAGASAVR